MKNSKSLESKIRFRIQMIIDWIRAGDPPPKTHYKSLQLMLFLIMIGSTLLVCFILSHFEIALTNFIPVAWPFLGLSCISLLPGLYILFLSICSWRRIKGYGWWMIPYVENFW